MRILPDGFREARAVLLTGPTASGKSALALDLAEASARQGRQGLVVNADSMQVYDALRVLTARPSAADESRAPHRLYGHVPVETRYSVGAWLRDAAAVLDEAKAKGRLPIVVGGTGLYFKALTEGLAATPAIPDDVRARLSARLATEGPETLHSTLRERDPIAAASIRPNDPQRILRALEVFEATGTPLSDWRRTSTAPLLAGEGILRLVLEPERRALYEEIEARFDGMLEDGAIDEVRALIARELDPDLPAMKATGVRELAAFLRGAISIETAAVRAKAETRRYAKRQTTWFRHQMRDWPRMKT
jgi:tRNA dimethylallyltransferase